MHSDSHGQIELRDFQLAPQGSQSILHVGDYTQPKDARQENYFVSPTILFVSSLARTLLRLREDRDLSQEQVGSVIGLSQTTYGRIETGQRKIRPDEVRKLSNYYGLPTEEIDSLSEARGRKRSRGRIEPGKLPTSAEPEHADKHSDNRNAEAIRRMTNYGLAAALVLELDLADRLRMFHLLQDTLRGEGAAEVDASGNNRRHTGHMKR